MFGFGGYGCIYCDTSTLGDGWSLTYIFCSLKKMAASDRFDGPISRRRGAPLTCGVEWCSLALNVEWGDSGGRLGEWKMKEQEV